jgi:hypothetical protein
MNQIPAQRTPAEFLAHALDAIDKSRLVGASAQSPSTQPRGTAMTTTTEPRMTTLPPIVCAPWCEDGDGHTDALFREDQVCRILSVTDGGIPLSRHGYVEYDGGRLGLDRLHVALFRDLFEEPYFEVGTESNGVKLTPDEARDLVRVLTETLDKIGVAS